MASSSSTFPVSVAHEPHYDVLAAAIAGTSATVLTLLAMLGGGSSGVMKMLYDAQLWAIEFALVVGMTGLIVRSAENNRRLSHVAAILLVIGTILITVSAVF